MGQIRRKEPPAIVIDVVEQFLTAVRQGTLVLMVQDSVVVRVEIMEKFNISAKERETKFSKQEKTPQKHPEQDVILAQLQDIRYGQLIIRVENERVEELEKVEKYRIDEPIGGR